MKRLSRFERLQTMEEQRAAMVEAICNADNHRTRGYHNVHGYEGAQFVRFLCDAVVWLVDGDITASSIYRACRIHYPDFYTMLNGNEEPRKSARRNR